MPAAPALLSEQLEAFLLWFFFGYAGNGPGHLLDESRNRRVHGDQRGGGVLHATDRGIVVGDTSGGAVMEARFFQDSVGLDTKVFYATSITRANLIMADGKSLENVGVTPDEKVLPSAKDLANNLDPAMSRAAELADVQLTPAEAGKLFSYLWAAL